MGKKGYTGLLALLLMVCGYAQEYPHRRYTSKDGLIADRITAITQDEQGFMWFGSYFGLCRYNGLSFQKIPLPASQQNKYVNCLYPTNGKVYAGFMFNGGMMEYDHGRISAHFLPLPKATSNEIACITADGKNGLLVCNSSGQLWHFSNNLFELITDLSKDSAVRPTTVLAGENQDIWIGTESGLYHLQGNRLQKLFAGFTIFNLNHGPGGSLLIGLTNGPETMMTEWKDGVFRSLSTGAAQKPVPFSGQPNNYWGIDVRKGLFQWLPGGNAHYYPVPLDLNTDITTIFRDREQNIWIANEPGILKISNFHVQSFPFFEIAAAGGAIAQQNDSVIWVSNSKSIYKIRNGIMTRAHVPQRVPQYFGTLFTEADNLWISYWDSGVWRTRWKDDKLLQEKNVGRFGAVPLKCRSIVKDSKGNVWVAGPNGLFRIHNDAIMDRYVPFNADKVPAFISCMILDEKNQTFWMGDNAAGILAVRYHQDQQGRFSFETIARISKKEGLTDPYVRAIAKDHLGRVWLGTRFGGIFTIENALKIPLIKNRNAEASLSCGRVTDIVTEDSTALWMASCDGVYRFDLSDNHWSRLNASNGILNAEVYNVLVDKKNNDLWALTSQGVTRLPLHQQADTVRPLVNIVDVKVLGETDSNALTANRPPRYTFNQNSVGISFAASSFIDENKLSYKYMLEGFDKDWSEPMQSNSVNYASLPPGNYTFKVLAANALGQWSAVPASFSFEIVLPFYRRAWFIFLMATSVLFVIYLVRYVRLRNQFRIERLRLHIARDLHDDVGSALGSINLLSKTASRRLEQKETAGEVSSIFNKIGTSAEDTLEAMDDIVWSINPEKDRLEDLIVRMREHALPLFEARDISCHFDVDAPLQIAMPMRHRRNLFMIYKEAVHNILKHADATEVQVIISVHARTLSMTIADNGKGFDSASPTTRNGLKNMRARAREIGGKVWFLHGNGTKLQFESPIK